MTTHNIILSTSVFENPIIKFFIFDFQINYNRRLRNHILFLRSSMSLLLILDDTVQHDDPQLRANDTPGTLLHLP